MKRIKRAAQAGIAAAAVIALMVWVLPVAWSLALLALVGFGVLAVFGPVAVRCGLGAMAVVALLATVAPVVTVAVHVALMAIVTLVLLGPVGVLATRAYQALRAWNAGRAVVAFEVSTEVAAPRVSAPVLRESA